MYKNVQCSCGRRFTIEISRGDPEMPTCSVCAKERNAAIAELVRKAGNKSGSVSIADVRRLRRANAKGQEVK